MQDYPGAPGSARQRNPGTDGPAACGGAAVPSPQAWDHVRSRAVPTPLPLPMPKASGHSRPGATPLPSPLVAARPRWPGRRRPVGAADHRPRAGSRQPAAPGCLAPRRCHSPHPYLSRASCPASADPPAACHRGHGLPPPTPPTRPAGERNAPSPPPPRPPPPSPRRSGGTTGGLSPAERPLQVLHRMKAPVHAVPGAHPHHVNDKPAVEPLRRPVTLLPGVDRRGDAAPCFRLRHVERRQVRYRARHDGAPTG